LAEGFVSGCFFGLGLAAFAGCVWGVMVRLGKVGVFSFFQRFSVSEQKN
jgi:hypothetical protein